MAEISQKRLKTDDSGSSSIMLHIATEAGAAKIQLPLGATPQSQFDKDRKFREALRSVADALSTYVGSNPALEAAEGQKREKKDRKGGAGGGGGGGKAERAGNKERRRERKKDKAEA